MIQPARHGEPRNFLYTLSQSNISNNCKFGSQCAQSKLHLFIDHCSFPLSIPGKHFLAVGFQLINQPLFLYYHSGKSTHSTFSNEVRKMNPYSSIKNKASVFMIAFIEDISVVKIPILKTLWYHNYQICVRYNKIIMFTLKTLKLDFWSDLIFQILICSLEKIRNYI